MMGDMKVNKIKFIYYLKLIFVLLIATEAMLFVMLKFQESNLVKGDFQNRCINMTTTVASYNQCVQPYWNQVEVLRSGLVWFLAK